LPRMFATAFLLTLFLAGGTRPAMPVLEWLEPIEVARGNGERGPWRQNGSRYDFVDDGTVALDAQGNAAVAWVDQANKRVLFQRYDRNGRPHWPQAVSVSRSTRQFSWLPRIALVPGAPDRVYLVWQEIIFSGGSHGGDILFARSNDGGASFSQPINLSASIAGAGKGRITREHWHNGSYDLAVGADGKIYVAWTEFEGRLLFARSSNGGERFSEPVHIAGNDTEPARGPALAAGADGKVYLGWTTGENSAADIRVARSDDGGARFKSPQAVARTASYSDAPKLALAGDGLLHLAYAESNGGPFDRFRIHYTRSTDGARSFEPPRVISDPAPSTAISSHFPHLALDGGGDPILVWELYSGKPRTPRGLGIAVSPDGGHNFSQPETVPSTPVPDDGRNGSTQGLLMRKLAVNAQGMVAIAHSVFRENQESRVWLLRGHLTESKQSGGR
jgi:hypothetical protein